MEFWNDNEVYTVKGMYVMYGMYSNKACEMREVWQVARPFSDSSSGQSQWMNRKKNANERNYRGMYT